MGNTGGVRDTGDNNSTIGDDELYEDGGGRYLVMIEKAVAETRQI